MAFILGLNTINNVRLGNTQVSELYLGSDKFWPPPTASITDSIFIEGEFFGNASTLQSVLVGSTIYSFSSSVFPYPTYASSSTNYQLLDTVWGSTITKFIDGGRCTSIPTSPLKDATNFVTGSFPGVLTVGNNAFNKCTSLKILNLSGLRRSPATGLGGSTGDNGIFANVPISGSITIPIQYAINNAGGPDGDLALLMGKGWTINYV